MSKYKTWSVPTSPRSPHKLQPELTLLSEFEGETWNKDTQIAYATKLGQSDFFEGSISKTEPDFSARDRINRAQKTFGFVDLENNGVIKITKAGQKLISGKDTEDLFLRQLLKWQYPSLKHPKSKYDGFKIKPFLEMLRLISEIDGLSKKEIAIFGLTLTDYNHYEETKVKILKFRERLATATSKREKAEITFETQLNQMRETFAGEIKMGNLKLREQGGATVSERLFLAVKIRNCIDYADAAIRYFRATGLFVISGNTYRLSLAEIKKHLAEEILKLIPRQPEELSDKNKFMKYLGNPETPLLPYDDKDELTNEIKFLRELIINKGIALDLSQFNDIYIMGESLERLREIKQQFEKAYQEFHIEKAISEMQAYTLYDDIQDTFIKIADRTDIDIPDKPLFLEWNTWRALNMLDDGEIQGNLKLDIEGKPLSNAIGKIPDIVCYYKQFVLVVEVTLSGGARQYETEGEPVARHLAGIRKNLRSKGDDRPVYGLFIAININEAVLAHFYMLRKESIAFYGGKTNYIPITLNAFQELLTKANENGGISSEKIFNFIKWADNQADISDNETDWYEQIINKTDKWLT